MICSSTWNLPLVSLTAIGIRTMYSTNYVVCSTEYTLTMGNTKRCLEDNMPLHLWKTLHQELRVPPRETAEGDCMLCGVNLWLLSDPSASWQRFAMALYTWSLEDLESSKLKLLPEKGLKNSPHSIKSGAWFLASSTSLNYQTIPLLRQIWWQRQKTWVTGSCFDCLLAFVNQNTE